jgi:hypothetical protein
MNWERSCKKSEENYGTQQEIPTNGLSERIKKLRS